MSFSTIPRLRKLAMVARRMHVGEKLPRGILIALGNAVSTDSPTANCRMPEPIAEDLLRGNKLFITDMMSTS